MRVAARDSRPRHRRGKASIVILAALCTFAAGVQALAPASAGAVANQTTTCLNMPPKGFTEPVPGMGWDPVGEFACKLDSAGAYYGGTDKKDSTPTAPAPVCTGRGCLPLGIGGGAGSGSGSDEVSGQRPGGRPTFPGKPQSKKKLTKAEREQREKAQADRDECVALLRAGKIGTPMYVLESNAERSISFIQGEMERKDKLRMRASLENRDDEREELRKEISAMRREINATGRALETVKAAREAYNNKGCSNILGR
jgi:hypothetical protein